MELEKRERLAVFDPSTALTPAQQVDPSNSGLISGRFDRFRVRDE
jgi:hypothetical protein